MSVQLYNPTTDELTQVAGEEFNDTVIRVSALPSASADLINETYLLVADQTGYAKGGIYQCQYVNDAFTWVLVNGSGMTVDVVEDGNMNGVTSNAVADELVDYAKKPSSSTANNLASLDANGNLVDSGVSKDVIPSDASVSNKLATKSDLTNFSLLTSNRDWINTWTTFGTEYNTFYAFTAPYSGKYRLHSSLIYNIENTDAINVNLRYYNETISTTIHLGQIASYGNSRYSINMDCIVELNAKDVVLLQFQSEYSQSIRWIQRDNNCGDYWQYLG